MTRNDDAFDFSRRTVLQGTAGLGTLGLAGQAAGRGNPGGGPPSSPPPGDGDDGGGDRTTVTLVTGHTVHVREDGGDTRYEVAGEDADRIRRLETDEGTYVVPDGVDLDRFSPLLFNVDFLIEQGVTDAETDAVPVVVSLDGDVDASAGVSAMDVGGFGNASALPSIDAVAGEVAKEGASATSRNVLGADVVERVHLDTRFEALLDESADVVNAPAAREEFGVDGSGVSIAVLDTGIDSDHPDFGDRVVHEEDFSGDGTGDGAGHGTHVAGIAAGAGAENGDYVGMAPGADLLNVKVLDDGGSGRLSDIVAGIEHAVAEGADVINLSLGGSAQEDGPLAEAVNAAVEEGVVAAVAAGNSGGYESVDTPGLAEGALTVGASDGADGVAGFSSGGPTPYDYRVKPEVAAPGVGITSTGSEGAGEYPYADKSGTSMSSPHVAGVAALLLADDADRGPEDVQDALVSTANPIDGEDVYKQGGGVVDVEAALGADLRVHGAVENFGLYTETATETATVTLENTGDEAVTVTPGAELVNVQSGDSLSDNVSVSPSSVTVEAGATETVSVTVDTEDAFGYNSGVLTLDADDGTTYRAIFGFVRGFEVTVDRNAHPENDPDEYGILMAWDHEASFLEFGFAPFAFEDEYTLLLLDDEGGFKEGGDFTFWLVDQLESGDRVFTVEQTTITPDNTHVTMDETATVPRELDTSQVPEHEPFEMRRFDAGLDAVFPDLAWFSYGDSQTGQHNIDTLYVSPIEESQPTTVSNAYLMYPEAMQSEEVLDSPVVYHLFDGALSIPPSGDTVTVDPDELAAETLQFHRPAGDESYSVYPHFYPADSHNHPKYISLAFEATIGADLAEQTWYRNDQTRYTEDWDAGPARFNRMTDFVPEAGASYRRPVGRAPFVGRLSEWSTDDDALSLRGHWYADQGEAPFVATSFAGNFSDWNGYSVRVDGDTVDTSITESVAFSSGDHDLSAGSTVEVSTSGNAFGATDYGTTTTTDYEVTYEPGTANVPPQVEAFEVTGLDHANGVAADQVVAFVTVAHEADGLADATVYYAPSAATSGTPFEEPGGWHEADLRYSEGGTLGAVLDVAGYTGRVDVAVSATDADGNAVQATTRQALTVREGAQLGATLDVKPDEIDPGSNGMVAVRIYHGDGLDAGQVDADSLRLGTHDAVHGDGGAAPVKSKRLGNGHLQVKFRANDTDFACGDGPVAAYVAGELTDGTPISGADVIADVVCDE